MIGANLGHQSHRRSSSRIRNISELSAPAADLCFAGCSGGGGCSRRLQASLSCAQTRARSSGNRKCAPGSYGGLHRFSRRRGRWYSAHRHCRLLGREGSNAPVRATGPASPVTSNAGASHETVGPRWRRQPAAAPRGRHPAFTTDAHRAPPGDLRPCVAPVLRHQDGSGIGGDRGRWRARASSALLSSSRRRRRRPTPTVRTARPRQLRRCRRGDGVGA